MKLHITAFFLCLSLASALAAKPVKDEKTDKIKDDLKTAPRVELPAKAADAVSKAKAADKEKVTEVVVAAVVEIGAVTLAPAVASIASAAPEVAAKAAATAAQAAPGQAVAVAVAAAQSAPKRATEIVEAVIAKVPTAAPELGSKLPPTPKNELVAPAKEAEFKGNPPPKTPPPHRPTVLPGKGNGNRPAIPPGLVRDPKPGRDEPRQYGRP